MVTLAYHSGDPGSIPGGGSWSKSVRVSEVNFYLLHAILHARSQGPPQMEVFLSFPPNLPILPSIFQANP